MKKYVLLSLLVLFQAGAVRAQTQEAAQLLLNYEKLQQLDEILDNMYKGYKILSDGYNRVKDIAEGNYKLHHVFLDGLYAVNPTVRNYKKVAGIINYQRVLLVEYRRAYDRFKGDTNFSREEIKYLENVYSFLVKQSLRNLDELVMVITAAELRMTDDERLKRIDWIYNDMEDKLLFLKYFNSSTQLLAVQRAKETNDVTSIQKLYHIEN